ncbi:hypothetical protein [Streptomyces sp.]|uniref:hypothetical protein n=1 Tax=Streptomyces sp. TaxID=1931 RepID=UPI002F92F94F
MTDPLKQNATLVEALGSSLRRGDHALGTVPDLLKRILREEAWREFVTQRGELVEHARFADFVATPPLKGIGSSVDLVRRIVSDDPEALDLLDQALQNPVGGSQKINLNVDVMNNESDHGRPAGTSKEYALRRLRKDAPELHAEVLAGHLSAHAAMVKAGFRKRTISVRLDRPESAALALRKHMPLEARQALARLLMED